MFAFQYRNNYEKYSKPQHQIKVSVLLMVDSRDVKCSLTVLKIIRGGGKRGPVCQRVNIRCLFCRKIDAK